MDSKDIGDSENRLKVIEEFDNRLQDILNSKNHSF